MKVAERLKLVGWAITGQPTKSPAPKEKTFTISRGILEQITWPSEEGLDDWGVLAVRKFRKSVTERSQGYSPHFSILSVRELIEHFGIPLTSETQRSMEALRELHCVDFKDLPSGLLERLPHWINHVISCGTITHPLIDGRTFIDV